MVRAGIAELKASLSEYLERVKRGEEVIVTDRGRPVARLAALRSSPGEVEHLIRRGTLRPAQGRLDVDRILAADLPEDPERRVLEALLEERESGW